MPKLKAFTWGYWRWGSESKLFVRAADALEKQRGFAPPLFVDLRYSRKVRAADFKDASFGEIVGSDRYRWMKKLGNNAIESKTGRRIQIADPSASKDLLKLILDEDKASRRVIMFCACLEPMLDAGDGYPSCHRVTVADLLLEEAKKEGVELEVAEWPGESPVSLRVEANDAQIKSFRSGKYIPIGPTSEAIPSMAVLGWGSEVSFYDADETVIVVTGPAYVRKGQWQLEVMADMQMGPGAAKKAKKSSKEILDSGYGPRSMKEVAGERVLGSSKERHTVSNSRAACKPETHGHEGVGTLEVLKRALSIQQPLSEQILTGLKTEEYRSQRTLIHERVYLYAGKKFRTDVEGFPKEKAALLPRSVILGSVAIVGCHWDKEKDCFAWELADPIRYPEPLVPHGVPQPSFWHPTF